MTLRDGRSPVNLLHIFKTPFPKKTSRRLLLIVNKISKPISGQYFISMSLKLLENL